MELLDRNLAFAGLPPVWRQVSRCVVVGLMVWLVVHPVMVLLDGMVQQVPMVMVVVVSVLKVVERLDMATALLVRMAMVRVLPDSMDRVFAV